MRGGRSCYSGGCRSPCEKAVTEWRDRSAGRRRDLAELRHMVGDEFVGLEWLLMCCFGTQKGDGKR